MFGSWSHQQVQEDFIKKTREGEEVRDPLGPEWEVRPAITSLGKFLFRLEGLYVGSCEYSGKINVFSDLSKANAEFVMGEISRWHDAREERRTTKRADEKAFLNATVDRYRK